MVNQSQGMNQKLGTLHSSTTKLPHLLEDMSHFCLKTHIISPPTSLWSGVSLHMYGCMTHVDARRHMNDFGVHRQMEEKANIRRVPDRGKETLHLVQKEIVSGARKYTPCQTHLEFCFRFIHKDNWMHIFLM